MTERAIAGGRPRVKAGYAHLDTRSCFDMVTFGMDQLRSGGNPSAPMPHRKMRGQTAGASHDGGTPSTFTTAPAQNVLSL